MDCNNTSITRIKSSPNPLRRQGNQGTRKIDGAYSDAHRCEHGNQRGRSTLPLTQNLKLTLSYDGTNYLGWQKTKEGPSVESALESALKTLLRHEISLNAASRTDAHVHAEGQVAACLSNHSFPISDLCYKLNRLLPKDIRINLIEEAPISFHPTLDARKKEYHYFVDTRLTQSPFDRFYAWHYPNQLNVKLIKEAAQCFMGTHDFSALQNSGQEKDPVRTIEDIYIEEGELLKFSIIGKSFLYKMVRNIVGTLIYVGVGKIQVHEIKNILQGKDRRVAGITAPAHGLTLKHVYY